MTVWGVGEDLGQPAMGPHPQQRQTSSLSAKVRFSSTIMKRVQYHGIHTFSSRTFSSPQEGVCVRTESSNLSFSQRDTPPPLSVIDTALLGWDCNLSTILDDSHRDASASHLPRSSTVDTHVLGAPLLSPAATSMVGTEE